MWASTDRGHRVRQLVKARLAYPASKAATVEYLKNHFDEDVSLSKIYRYLDKLSGNQHEIVQDISVFAYEADTWRSYRYPVL